MVNARKTVHDFKYLAGRQSCRGTPYETSRPHTTRLHRCRGESHAKLRQLYLCHSFWLPLPRVPAPDVRGSFFVSRVPQRPDRFIRKTPLSASLSHGSRGLGSETGQSQLVPRGAWALSEVARNSPALAVERSTNRSLQGTKGILVPVSFSASSEGPPVLPLCVSATQPLHRCEYKSLDECCSTKLVLGIHETAQSTEMQNQDAASRFFFSTVPRKALTSYSSGKAYCCPGVRHSDEPAAAKVTSRQRARQAITMERALVKRGLTGKDMAYTSSTSLSLTSVVFLSF